jgi:hypothetical protein
VALLTLTTTTAHGVVLPAAQAVSSSDTFTNTNGNTMLEVTNGGGSPITVTFVTSGVYPITSAVTYDIADDAQTVTNGTSKIFGPFDRTVLGTTVTVNFSATASVTARAIEKGSA